MSFFIFFLFCIKYVLDSSFEANRSTEVGCIEETAFV